MGVIRYYAYRFRIYYGVFPFSPPSGERVGERGLVKKAELGKADSAENPQMVKKEQLKTPPKRPGD